jgi:molybdopterin-guanine dinucleotide biosynthesis protein A
MIDAESETDAVIPMCNGEPQPLLGMYSKRLIGQLNDSIIQGKKSMKRFVLEIDTHFISEDEVRKIDPEGRSFININTVDDLKKVQGGNIC